MVSTHDPADRAKQERRRQILAAAKAVFADAGYHGASIHAIIERAQILTTHNLATLIHAGVKVDASRAASRCRAVRTTKPWVAAQVERQRIFFESLKGK